MTFTINGKEYKAREFDFGLVCDLQENGLAIEDFARKPLKMARIYFALCADKDLAYADNELGEHVLNGGNFEEIVHVLAKVLGESDFFQKLVEKMAKATETSETA